MCYELDDGDDDDDDNDAAAAAAADADDGNSDGVMFYKYLERWNNILEMALHYLMRESQDEQETGGQQVILVLPQANQDLLGELGEEDEAGLSVSQGG